MRKRLLRLLQGAAGLALAAALLLLAGHALGERKMARSIAIDVAPLVVAAPGPSLEQGRYLYATRGCADCHGANGAGKQVIASGAMQVVSPNITRGAHSATASYTSADWVRTLRHGVKPSGKPVMIMPSEDYNRLSDNDVAAIIAWVQQLAPVDGQRAVVRLPLAVTLQYGMGMVKDAAEQIDHRLPPQQPVAAAASLAHGAYVAHGCIGCHGAHLSGGKIPGAPAEWPAPANLTPGPGSAMARYPTPEALMAMMRTGRRPDGSRISSVMPFGSLRQMNDIDLRALHGYLQTLPPRAAGGR